MGKIWKIITIPKKFRYYICKNSEKYLETSFLLIKDGYIYNKLTSTRKPD